MNSNPLTSPYFKTVLNLIGLACGLFIVWSFLFKAEPKSADTSVLVFEDHFSEKTLDSTKWVDCYWWDVDGCTNAGNSELEWYLPENVYIKDGALILEARDQETTNSQGQFFPFTSGLVSTGRQVSDTSIEPKFSFQYGTVEVRAKFPEGKGLWPAIWLLPIKHESRPEIDILEVLGHETELARFHVHYLNEHGEKESLGETAQVSDLSIGWQTIVLDWQPDRITWSLNGEELWRVTNPQAIPQEPMYLILNLAVGGNYPGPPSLDTQFPGQMEVDYVRIWQ